MKKSITSLAMVIVSMLIVTALMLSGCIPIPVPVRDGGGHRDGGYRDGGHRDGGHRDGGDRYDRR